MKNKALGHTHHVTHLYVHSTSSGSDYYCWEKLN